MNNEMKLFVNRQASLLASDTCEAINKMLEMKNCSLVKSVDVHFHKCSFSVDIKIELKLYDQTMEKAGSTEMLVLLREKAINFADHLVASHELIIESVDVKSGPMVYQKELIVRMGFPEKPM